MRRDWNVLLAATIAAAIGLVVGGYQVFSGPALPLNESAGMAAGVVISFGMIGALAAVARNRIG